MKEISEKQRIRRAFLDACLAIYQSLQDKKKLLYYQIIDPKANGSNSSAFALKRKENDEIVLLLQLFGEKKFMFFCMDEDIWQIEQKIMQKIAQIYHLDECQPKRVPYPELPIGKISKDKKLTFQFWWRNLTQKTKLLFNAKEEK